MILVTTPAEAENLGLRLEDKREYPFYAFPVTLEEGISIIITTPDPDLAKSMEPNLERLRRLCEDIVRDTEPN
jgi:hypothetical protein